MRKTNQNKKAVSLMLSYVLLILIAFSIGILVYFWMKNISDPTGGPECPDGVSFLIRDSSCDGTTNNLTVYISNKGRFNIDGFVVRGSNDATGDAVINLIENDNKLEARGEGLNIIESTVGPLNPNEQSAYEFTYNDAIFPDNVYKIKVGAIRIQEENEREEIVVCKNTFVSLNVECL